MNQARIIFALMITMVIMLTPVYAAGTRTDIINRWVRASDNIPAKALTPADAAPLKHIGKATPVHNPVPRHLDAPHNAPPNQNINKAMEGQPSVIAKPIDQNSQAQSALDLRKSAGQLQNGKQREEILGAAKKAEDQAATLRHQNQQQQSDKRYFEEKSFQEKKGLGKRQAEQNYTQKSDLITTGRNATKPLNPSINISERGLKHTMDRHAVNDVAKFANKSKFNQGEDVRSLIELSAQKPMIKQANGNYSRTFDVGHMIGFDRNTRNQTSVMTVITRSNGELVTAYPGAP